MAGKTSSGTWKAFERTVAAKFGTDRTPLSGMCQSLTKADTLHPTIFIECKLRGWFQVFEKFRNEQKRQQKEGEKRPLVFRLTNVKKYSKGDIWLFDSEDLVAVSGAAFAGQDDEGNTRMRYLTLQVKLLPGKGDTIVTLYKDTEEKALKEGKIPVVAIKMKNRVGWLVAVAPLYLSRLKSLMTDE